MDYKAAGVDVEEGYRAVASMRAAVESTHTAGVLAGLGSFGAMFSPPIMRNPVLVSGTDGVGTKIEVARESGAYDTIGIDCVAMCVNDVLCHGAKPLFFLDYVAVGKLEAARVAAIVSGVAAGCRDAECALIGGETAEMPGVYSGDKFDLAGFCVGAVERDELIDGSRVEPGMAVIGLASSGLHSNGFSLVRALIPDLTVPFEGAPIARTLLEPTRIYVRPVLHLTGQVQVAGIAHVTGGGWYENLPRMLPKGCALELEIAAVRRAPIFDYLAAQGVARDEMYRTFNMGLGMALIVREADAARTLGLLNAEGLEAWRIGRVAPGNGEVVLR